jgi:uncharacterized coiled-coil protein SlyX
MRSLPPPDGLDPDMGDGLPAVANEVIAIGERALGEVRQRTVEHWIAAGAAWLTLQRAAMYRSNSNQPAGRRYAAVYRILEHPWPELTRIDRTSRKDAIWLFENEDMVRLWLASLSRKERDRWTHPSTIRRHYEKRHPSLPPMRKPRRKERPPRTARRRDRQPLGERTREDLEACIADLEGQVAERDREIVELNDQLDEQRRTIAQLQNDNRWLNAEVRQYRGIVNPPVQVEDAHESREITPPERFGKPHYAGWARLMTQAIDAAETAEELERLRADNREHIAAFEGETPGASAGIEQRIDERILQLQ